MNPQTNPEASTTGEKPLRLLRPSIVVLCGPAGCGKSTFAERHFRPTQIISSDWARARVSDDDRDQRCNTQAFALVHFLLEQRLTLNRLCVVDSTALTAQARKDFLELAKKHQVPATVLLFDFPLETCIERDKKRERSVGRAVVEHQHQVFEQTKESIQQEGFDQVIQIHEDDLEKIQIEVLFRPVVRAAQRLQQPGAFRRPERPASPFHQHATGEIRHTPVSGSVPPVGSASTPRPPAAASVVNSTGPQSTEAPKRVAGTEPPPAAHPPASIAAANKPAGPRGPSKPSSPIIVPPQPEETPGKN